MATTLPRPGMPELGFRTAYVRGRRGTIARCAPRKVARRPASAPARVAAPRSSRPSRDWARFEQADFLGNVRIGRRCHNGREAHGRSYKVTEGQFRPDTSRPLIPARRRRSTMAACWYTSRTYHLLRAGTKQLRAETNVRSSMQPAKRGSEKPASGGGGRAGAAAAERRGSQAPRPC